MLKMCFQGGEFIEWGGKRRSDLRALEMAVLVAKGSKSGAARVLKALDLSLSRFLIILFNVFRDPDFTSGLLSLYQDKESKNKLIGGGCCGGGFLLATGIYSCCLFWRLNYPAVC